MLQIHERIKAERIKAKLSEDELAEKIGIGRTTYQYWEKKTPAVDKIEQVAEALGLPKDYFFVKNDENIKQESIAFQVHEDPDVYNKVPAYGDPAFLAGQLASKDEVIKTKDEVLAEKEGRRLDAVRRAEIAEMEKDRLLSIIEQNLTALQINSAATLKQLSKVIRVMRADDNEMMDGQDRMQGLAVGTTSTRAGTVELAHEREVNKDHTKDDQSRSDKTGKRSKA